MFPRSKDGGGAVSALDSVRQYRVPERKQQVIQPSEARDSFLPYRKCKQTHLVNKQQT